MGRLDNVVQVIIDRQTKLPTRVGFGTPFILDINTVQTNQVDTFESLTAMEDAGFTTSNEAYKCALALFSQSPRPVNVKIGKRAANVAQVNNINVTDDDDGTYTVTINGIAFSFVASSNTVEQIVDGLVAAINAGSEPVTATDNVTNFNLTADVAGNPFSVVLTANPSDNMVLTTTTANKNSASELSRLRQVDDDFYFVLMTSRTDQDIMHLAAYVETLIKLFAYTTNQADSKNLAPATDTTSIMAKLKALNYDRTFGVWSEDDYPEAAWVGKNAPKDPGSITWKFKNVNGIVADNLTSTEKGNITGTVDSIHKNGNVYTTIGGIAMFEEGIVASGEFIDIMHGTDWIQVRIQENVFYLLTNEDKIPFTDKGAQQIVTQIEQILTLAVNNGILKNDPAPTVTVPKVADIIAADKAARFLQNVKFEGQYQGAVHKVKIEGTLTV
jgi:hypothetical protein